MLFEVAIMVLCCIIIIITKIVTRIRAKNKKHIQDTISSLIEIALFSQNSYKAKTNEGKTNFEGFTIPPDCRVFIEIIEVVESFDQRFSDQRFIDLKEYIFDTFLVGDAKKYEKSYSWVNRQLSARAYHLYPKRASEETLSKFLNDDKYLVRVVGAVMIARTHHKQLFFDMIRKMSEETELSQFPYRDALVQCDQEKFGWIEELLKTETNPKIVAICLDVLSTRFSKDLFPLIAPYAKSEDRKCRILAVKAVGTVASKEAIDLLFEHLDDSDWEVRTASIEGIKNLHITTAIPKLESMLKDPIWCVRLQSALTLKSFGEEGRRILTSERVEKIPLAKEIADYALAIAY